jgi:copper transport protein
VNSIKHQFWMKSYLRLLPILVLLFILFPSQLSAHAALIKSVPEPNSFIKTSPRQISLVFNERLEDSLYYIKVIDDRGQSVTTNKALLAADRTTMTLQLPKLPDGSYVVTYHIISADGHPVGSSYLITVGATLGNNTFIAPSQDLAGHTLSWHMSVRDILQSASRVVYYLSLLLLTGWVLWSAVLSNHPDPSLQRTLLRWRIGLLRCFMIALILLIYYHYEDLLGEGGVKELFHLFIGTGIGVSWSASFLLAIAGFIVLQRRRWIDALWVVLMIAVKCMNGHAIAFKPQSLTLLLDAVHLGAAMIWVGGLAIGIVFWRNKAFLAEWLPRFSRAVLGSIIVLAVSGTLTALLFLPKLSYVFYSQWGTLLLIKAGLVVGVAVVGALIRKHMRKQQIQRLESQETSVPLSGRALSVWFKVDVMLMVIIVAIVGLLTYAAPLPSNHPFNWHEMGEKAHLTVNITPNIPGTNTFNVEVWMPKQAGKPKQVQMLLNYEDDSSIAPIEVVLQNDPTIYGEPGSDSFDGFTRFIYKSEGPYLSFAGKWGLKLNIFDKNDEEMSYTNEMRIY